MSSKRIVLVLIVLANCCLTLYSQGDKVLSELVDSVLINDSLANYYAENGDIRKAQIYAKKNVMINSLHGKNTIAYAVSLLKEARFLYPNDREMDDEKSNEGLSILKDSLGAKSPTYTKYLLEYAWRQFNYNRIQEACSIVKDAAVENFTGDELFLGYLYYSYAHFLKEAEEFDLAKTYALKAISFYEEMRMYDDDNYLKSLTDLALLNIKDQEVFISNLNKAKDLVVKIKGKNSIDYLDVLLNFSYIYRYNNQFEEALDYAIQAKDTGEKIKEQDNSSYLYTLQYLSECYSSLKQYDKAIKYAEDCLVLLKDDKNIALEDRLPILDSLIVYYKSIPNVEKINLYAKEAYLIRKSLNISGIELVVNLFYLLHSNYKLGKYEECEANLNETKALYGDSYSTNYKHYYDDMEILMHSFFNRKQYKEALEVSNEIKEVYLKQYGEENEYLASILLTQASIYTYLGDFDKYHDYSLQALEILKKKYGELSPQYLSNLSSTANNFYNIGFEDSYSMLKKTACLLYDVYGKMNMVFVQNYLCAMILWPNYKEKFLDDYKLNDLYRYLQFQKIMCCFNDKNDNLWAIMKTTYELYILASLPSILQKYDQDSLSIDAIYNSLLFLKTKQPDINEIKTQIKNELSFESEKLFDDFCLTNNNYFKSMLAYANPEIIDSLYCESNQCISDLSKMSSTFQAFNNKIITTELIKRNMKEDEIVLDYLCLKHMRDGYTDYLVVIDKNKKLPDFIPVVDASKQIQQICDSYKTSYFFIDNDSIISSLNIDETNSNCIFGYSVSIEQILNRSQNSSAINRESAKQDTNDYHIDDFTSAYMEFERGVNLYNKKQYEKAIEAFYQCDSLMYIAKGEDSNYYGHGLHWIGSCYHQMGMDSIAAQYSNYYNLAPINMKLTIQSDSILDVAESLYNNGEIEPSLQKYIEASEIEKKKLGNDSYWYANTLSLCAGICNEIGDYKRAIELEKEAFKIRKLSTGINHIDYYWSLKNLYQSYSALDYIDDRIYYEDMMVQFMEKHKDELGEEFLFYPIYNLNLATLNAEKENKTVAYSYIMKAINSVDLLLDHPFVYMRLHYQFIYYLSAMGKDSLSFELCKKIIPFYEKNKDELEDSNNYFEILNIIANHYSNQGDYISASVYQERALNEVKDIKDNIYRIALSNIALTYRELGRIEEAINYAEKAVTLCDTVHNINEYANGLLNLAHCYAAANRLKDALRCGKKCYNIFKDNLGIDNPYTLVAATNLATYYDNLGYHEEFEKLLLAVIESAEKDKQKNSIILGTVYNNIAMDPLRKIDLLESLKYINKSYEIRKTTLGENDLNTIQSLYTKGRCLLDIDSIAEGVACIKLALNQTKDLIGVNNLRYIEMTEILPIIYGRARNLKRAVEIEEERNTLLKGIVDESYPTYLKSLDNLSELYFYINDTLKLYKTVIDESKIYRNKILSNFPNYTSIERTNVVNDMVRFYDWIFPLVCYYKKQPNLCAELYNSILLRKGLLLNSEIEFSRLIRESGDSALIRHYNELIANKNILNKQYQLPIEQRIFDIDSLRHAINEAEDFVVSASKEYGDFTRRFSYSWKDIKDKLNDDEISVEFVMFDDTCAIQNRIYYALIINKYSDSPELIPLCMEEQIQKALNGDKTNGIYQLIWSPILHKQNSIKKIFFSPSGILNNTGIEYVGINNHENISDKYTLFRLSSTREIIEKREPFCKKAALFGGLDYTADTESILVQNKRLGIESSSSLMYRGLSDSLSLRNSFEPLYNTKVEISEIGETLKKGDISVSMYSDTYGTEESFKGLSGKGMNIIHLATHGMYIGASEAESKKKNTNLSFIQLDDYDNGLIQEDKSLTRSFLVMSGGNMLPDHTIIPENMEDGILTALEISKMDLRGLDLVVLSACQTALGDIDNEGVYGLQRGFKKSGANTILMSLDKVDDEATKILMTEFYKNLMSGKKKLQSLKDAQKYLREVDNGKYNKPEYWASFIMLDGLN